MKKWIAIGIIVPLLLAVAVLTVGLLYNPPKTIPAGYSGTHIEVDGLRIRYLQQGAGPDVMLIHGSPGSIEDWSPILPALAIGHRVTVFDRPGHGFSGTPADYSLEANAQTALALIRKLGLKDVLVVGHSYGGGTALAMAVQNPPEVRGFVLMGTVDYGYTEKDPILKLIGVPYFGEGLARISGSVLGPKLIREGLLASFRPNEDAIPAGYVEDRIKFWSEAKIAVAAARERLSLKPPLRIAQRYREIRKPVLIIVGSEDMAIRQPERLQKDIAGSQLMVWQNTGHMLQFARPRQLVEAIESFDASLRRIANAPAVATLEP
jgi:pimeloyl-ACP methyl ester carboxylesterase